jgi:hypothetical protein
MLVLCVFLIHLLLAGGVGLKSFDIAAVAAAQADSAEHDTLLLFVDGSAASAAAVARLRALGDSLGPHGNVVLATYDVGAQLPPAGDALHYDEPPAAVLVLAGGRGVVPLFGMGHSEHHEHGHEHVSDEVEQHGHDHHSHGEDGHSHSAATDTCSSSHGSHGTCSHSHSHNDSDADHSHSHSHGPHAAMLPSELLLALLEHGTFAAEIPVSTLSSLLEAEANAAPARNHRARRKAADAHTHGPRDSSASESKNAHARWRGANLFPAVLDGLSVIQSQFVELQQDNAALRAENERLAGLLAACRRGERSEL